MTKSTSPDPGPATGVAASTGRLDSPATGHDDRFTDRDVFDRPGPQGERPTVERARGVEGVRV